MITSFLKVSSIMFKYSFLFFCSSSLLLMTGCCKRKINKEAPSQSIQNVLSANNMPKTAPKNVQAQLAFGLWNLDKKVIKNALQAGAHSYELAGAINGLPSIGQSALSPYAIILEGYLHRIYMEEDGERIRMALEKLYECVDFLIRNNVSVDEGVITLQSNPTMREFVSLSLSRLHAEKSAQETFDKESEQALQVWQKIEAAINKFQILQEEVLIEPIKY